MGEIQTALGLGEDFPLRNGGSLKVFPCNVAELEELAQLYGKFTEKTLIGLYLSGNEENKKAFHKLLLLANGQRDIADDEEKANTAAKEILKNFTMEDQGDEVYMYLRRFLGQIPRIAPAAQTQAEEEATN